MIRLVLLAALAGGVFLLVDLQRKKAPPPEPIVQPPALALPPAPVLSETELQKVRAATKDADPQVRWAAVELLFRVKDPLAGQVLRNVLSTDIDPEVKKKAIQAIQTLADPSTAQDLMVALKDHEKEVRIAALVALAEVGNAESAPGVVQMLKDFEPEVRMQALHTMGRFQEKRQEEYQKLVEQLKADYERTLKAQSGEQGFESRDVKPLNP